MEDDTRQTRLARQIEGERAKKKANRYERNTKLSSRIKKLIQTSVKNKKFLLSRIPRRLQRNLINYTKRTVLDVVSHSGRGGGARDSIEEGGKISGARCFCGDFTNFFLDSI